MGTPEFAVPSLDILLRHGYTLPAVVTAPDKPRGRGQEVTPTPVKSAALRNNIPILQPESLRDPAFREHLARVQPDLIVVVAFRILPKEIFTLPPLGSFNLHASLLPRYRGAAPINWAIMNGETETGVTTFFLDEKVDTGTMLLQKSIPITETDDAGSVHDRLAAIGADVVLETVRAIETGQAAPRKQDDAGATPAPKISKDDCHIRWNRPATSVHNMVRGLSPHPAAFALHDGKVLKIFRTRVTDRPATSPGAITASGAEFMVSASDRQLDILELQQEGRKRMSAAEFLRGYRFGGANRLE